MGKEQKSTGLLPVEEELIYRVGWLIKLRWLAATGLLISATVLNFFLNIPIEFLPLLTIGLVVIVYNILFKIYFQRSTKNLVSKTEPFYWLAYLQVGADWIALIFLIHYSGGIESPLIFCFVFHIAVSSILLTRRNCYWQVGFATSLLIMLALLEYLDIVHHVEMRFLSIGGFYDDPISVGAVLSFLVAIIWIVAYLTTSVTTKLKQREKDLFALEEKLEKAYRKLEKVDRARSNFVLGVTHELRSPLASIGSSLSLFDEGYLGEISTRQQKCVERMQERVECLLMLVMDLLKLARLKEGGFREQKTKVDIRKIVNLVTDSLRPQAEYKGIDLKAIIPSHPLYIWADAEEMELLFSNLLGNAIKYTSPKGNVKIKAWKEGCKIKTEVSDSGIGIAEGELEKIFTEFYRSKNARAIDKAGTGLGLPIVKRIVERYGGKIVVQSAKGKGSKFYFALPAHK